VPRPQIPPFSPTTLPLLHPPAHRYHTPWIRSLSCRCPCPAPRDYPLPARTSRRPRGGSLLGGHGDVSAGGSSWTVTGPLSCFDLPAHTRPYDTPIHVKNAVSQGPGRESCSGTRLAPCVQESTPGTRPVRRLRATGALG
jgi:hypothetical protein